MKRFLKVFVLLIVCLLLLVSGLDAALDQLSRSETQNNYTLYSGKGNVEAAYAGDLTLCKPYVKPVTVTPPFILHRT